LNRHILDRDHRLRGEGLQELDLFVRKWLDHLAADHDGTERHSFAQEWRHESGPPAAMTRLDACSGLSVLGRGKCLDVLDMNRPTLDHGPA
jgi:hypothetical protein